MLPQNATRYEIKDTEGKLIALHIREDKPDGSKDVRWSQQDGTPGLNGTKLADLPLYGSEDLADYGPDELVVVAEGEKARDFLAGIGIPSLGTVTGASGTPSEAALEVLRGRRIALWPDNDDQGRQHMQNVAQRLHGKVTELLWYEWPEAEEKGDDAADHPATKDGGEKTVGKLRTDLEGAPRWKPPELRNAKNQPKTAAELLAMDLPEIRWAVPDIIPEGVSILAGKPKLGKSWMALGLCVAVASGGMALGNKPVEKGEALYLGLEDNTRRLQKRMKAVLGDEPAPEGLYYETEYPRMDEGGLVALDEWLDEHPDCRLVVIDTLAKYKPAPRGGRSAYDEDRETVDPLSSLIEKHGVAIVLVHHLRKMAASDPIDEINASTGLSAGVDGVLLLRRERGEADASLYVDGREIEEAAEIALKWDQELTKWVLVGNAEDYRQSAERRKVIETLRESPESMGPRQIADETNLNYDSLRHTLTKMSKEGVIDNPTRGKYTAIHNAHTVHNVHNAHSDHNVHNADSSGELVNVNEGSGEPFTNGTAEKPINKGNVELVNDVNDVNGVSGSHPADPNDLWEDRQPDIEAALDLDGEGWIEEEI